MTPKGIKKIELVLILNNLSNGEGTKGMVFPKYIWVYPTLNQANARATIYKFNHKYSMLSKPQKWVKQVIINRYVESDGIDNHYYIRKES